MQNSSSDSFPNLLYSNTCTLFEFTEHTDIFCSKICFRERFAAEITLGCKLENY